MNNVLTNSQVMDNLTALLVYSDLKPDVLASE